MGTIKGAKKFVKIRSRESEALLSSPLPLSQFSIVSLLQPPFSFFVFRFAVDYSGVLEYSTSSQYLPSLEPHSIS